jgi:surface antigen
MTQPIDNSAIQIFEEHKIVEVVEAPPPPPELSLEDKIKLNINNCNTDTHWISAEDATCLPKRSQVPVSTQKASTGFENAPQGYYPKGQCTWYVSTRRPVGQWGDASEWKANALADGYTFSATPVPGAIAWRLGHVAYVETVHDNGTVTISEANYDYRGSIRTITIPVSEYQYLY